MTKLGHAQYPLHEENHSIPEERFFTSQQAGRTTDFSEAKIANDPNGFRNWKAVLFHARRPRRLQADREKIPRGKRPRRAPGREPSPTSRAPLNRAINVSHRVINITRVLQFTRSQRVNLSVRRIRLQGHTNHPRLLCQVLFEEVPVSIAKCEGRQIAELGSEIMKEMFFL